MPSPSTFIAEEDAAPSTFVSDEGTAPKTFVADAAPVQAPDLTPPKFESPLTITDQGPVYAPAKVPQEPPLGVPWSAGEVLSAPVKAAGGMIATGLNLASPTTWLPQSERERQAMSFGDPRTPAEQAQAKMFQGSKKIYQPQGTSIDPQGSDLERLLSDWSTPEQMAMLPMGMSRAGAALLLTQVVPQLEDQIKSVISGEGTENEKRDKINNLFSIGIMMAHGAGKVESGGTGRTTPDLETMKRAQVPGMLLPERTTPKPVVTVAPEQAPIQSAEPSRLLGAPTAPEPPVVAPAPETSPVAPAATPEAIAKELGATLSRPVRGKDQYQLVHPDYGTITVLVPKGSPIEAVQQKIDASVARFKEAAAPTAPTVASTTETPEIRVLGVGIFQKIGDEWVSQNGTRYKSDSPQGKQIQKSPLRESHRTAPPSEPTPPPAAAPEAPAPFKAGDAVDHQGQTKTIKRMSPDGKFAVIGNRAIPVSEIKPAAPENGKGLAGEVRRRLEAGDNLGGEAGGGVPIGDLLHEFGKTLYTKGMEFAQWSARMVKELGEKSKAWLERIWNRITVSASDLVKMTPEELVAWKKKAIYGPDLMQKMANAVEDQHLPSLIAERDRLRQEINITIKGWTKQPSEAEWKDYQFKQVKAQTLNEMIEHAPKPTATYMPGIIEAGAGIPIPTGITSALKKTRDTIKTLARTKGIRAVMAYTKDVAGNVATVYGQRVGNNVRGELRRAMGRGPKPNVLDENALTFAREANGDRGQLAVMRGKLTASTLADPKWKAAALKSIDHADANWNRLNPIASKYEGATHAQIVAENAAGINTIERPGYVMHAQDVQSDFGFFSDVAGEGTTGFKHARAYNTFADSIAAGVDPKSINSVALLTQRVARGQMLINNRLWVEGLKTTVDPHTRKTVVTEPEVIPRGPGLPPDVRAPTDYVTEIAGGRPIAILKSYAGIFRALTEPSKFSESLGWNATLKVATTGKHVALMLDTFHLGRIAFWESIIKPLSFTDPKLPLPSYKRGVLTLDYSRAELQRMAASGEIDPAKLPAVLDAQRDVNGLVKHGYNVAKISDMLHQEWLQKIPITGHFNKWLFNQFQRGAMAEVGSLEVGRYRRMHPSWSDDQVYREVAKDLNTRFGNFGRQGWLKSKTAQDAARLLALAPQWNEGLIRSEIGAITGTVKGIGSSIKEGRPSFGILPRAIGAMLLGQFIANQIINYITRGKPTWENEEEGIGAKLSAWVPDVVGGGPGFFLHPAGLAAEVTHLLTQKYEKKGDLREALLGFIGGRYSTLARPLVTFLTRHDVFGKLIRPENIWKETAKSAIPSPIGASAAVPAIKQAVTGEKKETFPGQYQKQVMASMGVKTDQAPSPGQRIQALAANFRKSRGITESGEFYESAYAPLRDALKRGAVKEAKQAYDDLINADHKEGQIAAAMRPWTGGNVLKNGRVTPTNPKPFSGSSKHEAEFLDTLTPEQTKTAEAAYAERVRIFRVFQDMLE